MVSELFESDIFDVEVANVWSLDTDQANTCSLVGHSNVHCSWKLGEISHSCEIFWVIWPNSHQFEQGGMKDRVAYLDLVFVVSGNLILLDWDCTVSKITNWMGGCVYVNFLDQSLIYF